jgi:hypothetical protein
MMNLAHGGEDSATHFKRRGNNKAKYLMLQLGDQPCIYRDKNVAVGI